LFQDVEGDVMQDELCQSKKTKLALAIARGESITLWARENEVPRRTAYRWAREAEVRRAVEEYRRWSLSRAIGRMTTLALKAADGIAKLAKGADSESVQLRAWRALLIDQLAIAKFSDLEHRMLEIEEELRERTGYQDHAG
jgi:hypothetical protein